MVAAFWCFLMVGGAASRYKVILGLNPDHEADPAAIARAAGATVFNINRRSRTSYVPMSTSTGGGGSLQQRDETADLNDRVAPSPPARSGGCCSSFCSKAPWFKIHVILQCLGVVLAIAGLIAVESALKSAGLKGSGTKGWGSHQKAGCTALASVCTQLLLGALRPSLTSKWRRHWLLAHRGVAAMSLLAGLTAVPLGLNQSGILGGPGIIIVASHALCACLYVVVMESCLACRTCRSGPNTTNGSQAAVVAPAVKAVDASQDWSFSGASSIRAVSTADSEVHKPAQRPRRSAFVHCINSCVPISCTSLLFTTLAAVQMAWVGLQKSPKTALSQGAVWQAPESQRVYYPGGEQNLCFHFSNYTVPARETSYMCRGFALPPEAALHAIDFIPMVDAASAVHHMILYSTDVDVSAYGPNGDGVFDCASMPHVNGPMWVWAVGGSAFTLPADVGIRVGADAIDTSGGSASSGISSGVAYAILQMHYNNPSSTSGMRDSSGVLVRVTDALRKIDAGFIQLGTHTSSIHIPPGQSAWGAAGTCASSTTHALPSAATLNPLTHDFTVVASALHMHTLGRRMWIEQWRGGSRLLNVNGTDTLGHDERYDFGNQKFLFTSPVAPQYGSGLPTLRAGDELITRCIWENTVAAGVSGGNTVAAAGRRVDGGEATTNEMCIAFLIYYPRLPSTNAGCGTAAQTFCDSTGAGGLPQCSGFS